MADGVRTNFMVFPQHPQLPCPMRQRVPSFWVFLISWNSTIIPVETHGRASLQSPVCMDTLCVHTIIAVHVSTIIPVRPYKYPHTRSRNKSRACPNNYHRAHFNNYPHPSMQMFSYVLVMIPVRLCAHIALCYNVVLCTLQQSLPMRSGRVL